MTALEPPAEACLERTRSTVMNILAADGVGIALSGWLLRRLAAEAPAAGSKGMSTLLMGGLLVLVVAGYLAKRLGASRESLLEPSRRARRFYRAHVIAAAVGAAAVPLGLAYGWLVRPRLDGVAPFWVASIGLGCLALPRSGELSDFDRPPPACDRNEQ